MKKLKVYNGSTNGINYMVVAASNKKRAVELINIFVANNMTLYHFSQHWCESGNNFAMQLLEEGREGVWVWHEHHYGDREPDEKHYMVGADK